MITTLAGIPIASSVAARIDLARYTLSAALERADIPRPMIDAAFVEHLFQIMPAPGGVVGIGDPAHFAERFENFSSQVCQRRLFEGRVTPEGIFRAFAGYCESGRVFLEPENAIDLHGLTPTQAEYVRLLRGSGELLRDQFLYHASALVDAMESLGHHAIMGNEEKEWASSLRLLSNVAQIGDIRLMALFADTLLGPEMQVRLDAASARFQEVFLESLGTTLPVLGCSYQDAVRRGDPKEERLSLEELKRGVKRELYRWKKFGLILERVTSVLKNLIDLGLFPEAAIAPLSEGRAALRLMVHDFGNTTCWINGLSEMLDLEKNPTEIDDLVQHLCEHGEFHRVDGLLRLAARSAQRSGDVAFEITGFRPIPATMRTDLFFSLSELFENARKYRDPAKPQLRISASVHVEGEVVRIAIRDNGVGIRDVEKVLQGGTRERPELARGTGLGLSGIAARARKHGWQFEVRSQPGEGTEAAIALRCPDSSASLRALATSLTNAVSRGVPLPLLPCFSSVRPLR